MSRPICLILCEIRLHLSNFSAIVSTKTCLPLLSSAMKIGLCSLVLMVEWFYLVKFPRKNYARQTAHHMPQNHTERCTLNSTKFNIMFMVWFLFEKFFFFYNSHRPNCSQKYKENNTFQRVKDTWHSWSLSTSHLVYLNIIMHKITNLWKF